MKIKSMIVSLLLLFALPLPAVAAPIYSFPVAGCTVTYTKYHHDYPASDIFAKKGCAFVAPIAGVVDEMNAVDRWRGCWNW